MNNLAKTITAISTPLGKGGVALIRLSGAEALAIAERVFFPRGKRSLSEYPPRYQVYGDIVHEGERVDDGLATYFKAPSSYTGEDTVEITCHGGVLITRTVLEALLAAGAVLATAGEFTKRAFIGGRLSLTDAEAIGELLEAKSHAQLRLYATDSRDRLSSALKELRSALLDVMSSIFARIDYPDEDLGDYTDEETLTALEKIGKSLDRLLATYKTGRAIHEGVRTVIAGKTNVGKSSLYNALLGEDAAIVTDIPGTTRDSLEREISLGRVMLALTDTAGFRDTADAVEKIGVERAARHIEEAELILTVFDGSRPLDHEDLSLIERVSAARGTKIALINKSDLPEKLDRSVIEHHFSHVLTLSARYADTSALTALVEELFTDGDITIGEDAILFSARQYASLLAAKKHIDDAIHAYADGLPADVASSDIELALAALGELDGREVSEMLVQDIFSKFCVGK